MTDRLRFFGEAAEEIEEAAAWYGRRSEIARTAFLREIDHAVEAILEAPARWPSHTNATRRFVCATFPYAVFYFVEGETVIVVAVAHERRRPGYWRGRL